MSLAELFYAKHPRRRGLSAERRRRRRPKARKVLFEALEPRVLLSADLLPDPTLSLAAPAALTIASPLVVIDLATTAAPETAPTADTHEIVFIDPSVENHDALIGQLNAQSIDDPRATPEVFVLDSERDGVDQMTQVLSHRH